MMSTECKGRCRKSQISGGIGSLLRRSKMFIALMSINHPLR
jgi:hypothetical protein